MLESIYRHMSCLSVAAYHALVIDNAPTGSLLVSGAPPRSLRENEIRSITKVYYRIVFGALTMLILFCRSPYDYLISLIISLNYSS